MVTAVSIAAQLRRYLCFAWLGVLLCGLHSPGVAAQQDVRILIDISGSMKQSDPNNLRRSALELLIELLPQGTEAGVWTFGQYVNMLIKHGVVDDAWKQQARQQLDQINSVALRTHIGDALDRSSADFSATTAAKASTHFIVLTDGKVDVSADAQRNRGERDRIIEQLIPRLSEHAVRVHTISLSDQADQSLLDLLAVSTGGLAAQANSADELMALFLKVFDQAVPADQVPLQGQQFSIDDHIEEFTVLAFNQGLQPIQLLPPDAPAFSALSPPANATWFKGLNYDLVTVTSPAPGQWSIEGGIDPGSRVTVVSDLQLQVPMASTAVFAAEPIALTAELRSREGAIDDPDFLGLLSLDAVLSNEQKQAIPVVMQAQGAVFSATLPRLSQPGDYTLDLQLDGKSFQRQRQIVFQVSNPLSVEVLVQGDHYAVRLYALHPQIDPQRSKIVGQLTQPDGRIQYLPFQFTQGYWQLPVSGPPGEYRLDLDVRLMVQEQALGDIQIEPIRLSLPVAEQAEVMRAKTQRPLAAKADAFVAQAEKAAKAATQAPPVQTPEPTKPDSPPKAPPVQWAEPVIDPQQALDLTDPLPGPVSTASTISTATMMLLTLPAILVLMLFFMLYRLYDARRADANMLQAVDDQVRAAVDLAVTHAQQEEIVEQSEQLIATVAKQQVEADERIQTMNDNLDRMDQLFEQELLASTEADDSEQGLVEPDWIDDAADNLPDEAPKGEAKPEPARVQEVDQEDTFDLDDAPGTPTAAQKPAQTEDTNLLNEDELLMADLGLGSDSDIDFDAQLQSMLADVEGMMEDVPVPDKKEPPSPGDTELFADQPDSKE